MVKKFVGASLIVTSLCACSNDRHSAGSPTTPTPTAEAQPSVPASPTPPARVQGIVLDFQSAKPIRGAVVGFATNFFLDVATGMTETSVTDADGRYSLTAPPANEPYRRFIVDNKEVGSGFPRAANYRADVAVDRGLCISRYGVVLDSKTYLPISGVTFGTGGGRGTGPDGWYQFDWGCGVGYTAGFNTVLLTVSHPNYVTSQVVLGRGVAGVYRMDLMLNPR